VGQLARPQYVWVACSAVAFNNIIAVTILDERGEPYIYA
jgi:hypothetical protein